MSVVSHFLDILDILDNLNFLDFMDILDILAPGLLSCLLLDLDVLCLPLKVIAGQFQSS